MSTTVTEYGKGSQFIDWAFAFDQANKKCKEDPSLNCYIKSLQGKTPFSLSKKTGIQHFISKIAIRFSQFFGYSKYNLQAETLRAYTSCASLKLKDLNVYAKQHDKKAYQVFEVASKFFFYLESKQKGLHNTHALTQSKKALQEIAKIQLRATLAQEGIQITISGKTPSYNQRNMKQVLEDMQLDSLLTPEDVADDFELRTLPFKKWFREQLSAWNTSSPTHEPLAAYAHSLWNEVPTSLQPDLKEEFARLLNKQFKKEIQSSIQEINPNNLKVTFETSPLTEETGFVVRLNGATMSIGNFAKSIAQKICGPNYNPSIYHLVLQELATHLHTKNPSLSESSASLIRQSFQETVNTIEKTLNGIGDQKAILSSFVQLDKLYQTSLEFLFTDGKFLLKSAHEYDALVQEIKKCYQSVYEKVLTPYNAKSSTYSFAQTKLLQQTFCLHQINQMSETLANIAKICHYDEQAAYNLICLVREYQNTAKKFGRMLQKPKRKEFFDHCDATIRHINEHTKRDETVHNHVDARGVTITGSNVAWGVTGNVTQTITGTPNTPLSNHSGYSTLGKALTGAAFGAFQGMTLGLPGMITGAIIGASASVASSLLNSGLQKAGVSPQIAEPIMSIAEFFTRTILIHQYNQTLSGYLQEQRQSSPQTKTPETPTEHKEPQSYEPGTPKGNTTRVLEDPRPVNSTTVTRSPSQSQEVPLSSPWWGSILESAQGTVESGYKIIGDGLSQFRTGMIDCVKEAATFRVFTNAFPFSKDGIASILPVSAVKGATEYAWSLASPARAVAI